MLCRIIVIRTSLYVALNKEVAHCGVTVTLSGINMEASKQKQWLFGANWITRRGSTNTGTFSIRYVYCPHPKPKLYNTSTVELVYDSHPLYEPAVLTYIERWQLYRVRLQ